MASDGNLAKEIFLKIVDQVPESEWDDRIASECNGDQELFDRVKRLLMAHANPRSDVLGDAFQATAPSDSMDYLDLTNKQIGPYKLQEIIGEGGMGTVFMAEQTEPIHRSVAVKLIKPGMDSRQVVARFKAERQALSLMDHPNIAKIFDGGATDAGHPFFVMELVKGVRITDFCDAHRLDTNARLRLFQQVCYAVQHAHQKGVIHRDIKPSNILVAMYDDQPVPKVIDFGLAKATGDKLSEESYFTGFGQLVGTLQYMSPEQSQLNQLDIDTRSDIYSLGVILYELLVGEPPFDREQIRQQALDETLRMIREDEPTKPSTKLSQAPRLRQIASSRNLTPEGLGELLRGDLDWIAMTSLAKERSNRYQTAGNFASDIQRYLDGEAVLAHPPSRAYQLRKFCRKHRGSLIAATLVFAALVAGIIGTSVGLLQAESHLKTAERQRDRAMNAETLANHRADTVSQQAEQLKKQADDLRLLADFQADMLDQVDPAQAGQYLTQSMLRGLEAALDRANISEPEQVLDIEAFNKLWRRVSATDTAREFIDTTVLRPALESINVQFSNNELLAARLRLVIAKRYRSLGYYDLAQPLLEESLAALRLSLGDDHPDVLDAKLFSGKLLLSLGKYSEAEQVLRVAFAATRNLLGEAHQSTLAVGSTLGGALAVQNKLDEAETLLRHVFETSQSALGDSHECSFDAIYQLASVLNMRGRRKESEALIRQGLRSANESIGPDDPKYLRMQGLLGMILLQQKRHAEAEVELRRVVENHSQRFGLTHHNTLASKVNLAIILNSAKRTDEAETLLRQTLLAMRAAVGDHHPDTMNALSGLANSLFIDGRGEDAEGLFREAFEISQVVLGENHRTTINFHGNIGRAICKQGDLSRAEPILGRELKKLKEFVGEGSSETIRRELELAALVYSPQENQAAAEEHLRNALSHARNNIPDDDPLLLSILRELGYVLLMRSEAIEAEKLLREGFEKQTLLFGEEHLHSIHFELHLARALSLQRKYDEAERHFTHALELARVHLGNEHDQTITLIAGLARNFAFQSKYDDAEPLLREALRLAEISYGTRDTETIGLRINLGICLTKQSKLSEAELLIREVVDLKTEANGVDAVITQQFRAFLAEILSLQLRFDEAEALLRDVISVTHKTHGKDHKSLDAHENALGIILWKSGKFAEAEHYYRTTWARSTEMNGELHQDTLARLSNLGVLLKDQGNPIGAEPLIREALEKRRRALGDNHPQTIKSVGILCGLLGELGKFHDAERLIDTELARVRKALGDDHPETLSIQFARAQLYCDQQRFHDAEIETSELVNKSRQILGDRDSKTLFRILVLAKVLVQLAKFGEAERCVIELLDITKIDSAHLNAHRLAAKTIQSEIELRKGNANEAIELILSIQSEADQVFTRPERDNYARLLTVLGTALSQQKEFERAERALIEANEIYAAANLPCPLCEHIECIADIAKLYTAWHISSPDEGFDTKADEWDRQHQVLVSQREGYLKADSRTSD